MSEENLFEGFDLFKKSPLDTTPVVETEEQKTARVAKEATDKELADKKAAEDKEKSDKEKADKEIADKELADKLKAEEEKKKLEEEEEASTFIPFIKHLNDKGVLDLDDEFEVEDSEEGFENAVGETVKKQVDKWKKAYPDEIQKLLQFTEAGGTPKQFYDIFYSEHSWKEITADSEENQKAIVKATLKGLDWSDEEIESEIADYTDLGKLKTKAEAFLPKLQKAEQSQKDRLIQAQEEFKTQRIKDTQEYWDNMKTEWFKKEDLNGFKLTPKIKEAVWEHMSIPADRKTGKTQLQLNNEKNKDAQFIYAYLDYIGFDFKKLDKTIETKKISELKDKLDKFKDPDGKVRAAKTGAKTIQNQEVNEDPFEAFSSIQGKK